jgi:Tfp pilus assembly protein PilV
VTVQVSPLRPGRSEFSPTSGNHDRRTTASRREWCGGRKERGRRDRGETLIEVVITVVIIAISVTALISSLATTGSAGQTQRNSVLADTVLRNYAEATEAAVRSCQSGATYTVAYTPPTGFSVTTTPATSACPIPTSTQTLTLSVTGPAGFRDAMQIKVRTP